MDETAVGTPVVNPYLVYLDEAYVFPLGWTRGEDGQLEYIGREN